MKIQKLRQYLEVRWKPLALYGGLFAILAGVLFWQLGSLLPGYSASEAATYDQATMGGAKAFLDNPINAPFILLVKALSYLIPHNLVVTRLAAVIIGLATLVLFAALLARWHDRRTTIIGTLLLGVSAWFLHTARLGAPETLLFGVFALTVCGYWLKHTGSKLALISSFLLAAVLLYVPGIIWFIALGTVWQWKVIDRAFKKHLLTVTLSGLGLLVTLGPLAWALYKQPAFIKPWLGLPSEWPNLLEAGRNLLEVPFHLFVHNEANPAVWLGTAPILDIFSITMFVLGGYLYLRHVKLGRTSLFIAIAAMMALLMALGGSVTFTVIMPFIYLVVAAGVSYLLSQWFQVFPRNPIARSIGITVMCLVVGVVYAYHLTHYFVGWPGAQATHDTYIVQKP